MEFPTRVIISTLCAETKCFLDMEDMSFFYAVRIFLISCGFSTVFTFRQGSVLFFPNTLAPSLRFCYNQSCRPQGADERFSLPSNFTQSGSSPPRRTPIISFSEELAMNISYDSYRVFYYAAKYRSFSQAAAALYSNQPNVTRMIRKLESELGSRPRGRSSTRTSPSRLRASRQAKRRSSPTRACKAVSSTSQRAALPYARGFCRCSRATGAHTRTCASA